MITTAMRTEAHAAPGFDPVVYARLLARFRALPRSAPGERWLLLVPLGHLTGRLPIGNPGRAHVSAFRPMAVRADIAEAIAQAGPTIP